GVGRCAQPAVRLDRVDVVTGGEGDAGDVDVVVLRVGRVRGDATGRSTTVQLGDDELERTDGGRVLTHGGRTSMTGLGAWLRRNRWRASVWAGCGWGGGLNHLRAAW